MRLESIADGAWKQGVAATVFNCPEIRTNSSDIFVGVELSLFPLLTALKKEGGGAWAQQQWDICQGLLGEGVSLQSILDKLERYLQTPTSTSFRNFEAWPMDNTPELADLMIGTSDEITSLHTDKKALITDHLSSLVLEGTGPLMFHGAAEKIAPVLWLNHDIIARQLNACTKTPEQAVSLQLCMTRRLSISPASSPQPRKSTTCSRNKRCTNRITPSSSRN
jgi:hypothetical protein